MDIDSESLSLTKSSLSSDTTTSSSRLRSHSRASANDPLSRISPPSSPGRGATGISRVSDFNSITRSFRVRWLSLSTSKKVYFCLAVVLSFYVLLSLYDACFHSYQIIELDNDDLVDLDGDSNQYESFGVIINTFRRPDFLKDAVIHYAEKCGIATGVESVFIVWAEEGVTPPAPDSFFRSRSNVENRSFVNIHPVKNSLNNRFQPIIQNEDNKHLFQSSEVPSALFMVDDDMRIDCFSLRKAFEAWKQTPKSMVGFYPRLSIPPRAEKHKRYVKFQIALVYQSWPIVYLKQQMNFILTKACFLHKRYMDIYMSPEHHPVEILDYVDKYMNCEDVAMSMLVANITRMEARSRGKDLPARPIYVEGKSVDKGLFKGISTNTGHMKRRSDCLRDLSTIYYNHGWGLPLIETFDLRQSSYKKHAPNFWFQMRPSNVFEWFALSNVFL